MLKHIIDNDDDNDRVLRSSRYSKCKWICMDKI